MGKYSFKPKRVNGTAGINTLENTSAYSQIAIPNTKLHTQDQDKEQEKLHLLEKLGLFDKIVTHNYLFTLNKASVINISSDKISGMGWYKITKIVLDEDKFFPDQLSMLYTSLHDIALNIALVIQKSNDNIEIYLGARDFNEEVNCEASSLLSSAIHGFLQGIGTEYAVDKKFISSTCWRN